MRVTRHSLKSCILVVDFVVVVVGIKVEMSLQKMYHFICYFCDINCDSCFCCLKRLNFRDLHGMEILGQTSKESDVKHEKGVMIAVYFLTQFLISQMLPEADRKREGFLMSTRHSSVVLLERCSICVLSEEEEREREKERESLVLHVSAPSVSLLCPLTDTPGIQTLYSTCAFSFPLFSLLSMTTRN